MEAAPVVAAAALRGGSLVRARVAYGGARGLRRVVGAGLAAPGCRRVPVVVAALPEPLEPLPLRSQQGDVSLAPEADDEEEVEFHGDSAAAAETSSHCSGAPGKTVRVRFVLKKQCPFGQSFHLVGDDPALGLWDPSEAVALRWAEGHQWIIEKDLPANKLVEFKFLLQDTSGNLHWQDGPNRSLQTAEAVNTLVVYEDWSDVKNQKIAEQGKASIGMEDVVVSDDSESRKANVIKDELQMDDNKDVEQDESIVTEDKKSAIATNVSDQGESMKANKADPSVPSLHEELKLLDRLHEKEDKRNKNVSCADESSEKTNDNILSEDGVPVENGLTNAYEHDFLWGWKALQKLLMSLGFKMDTS